MKTMKKLILILVIALLVTSNIFSQIYYEPTWESLDSRPTPEWFHDARFGIFIHWGLYSVPGYTSKSKYAEWYWHQLQGDTARSAVSKEVFEFHVKNYGEDYEYPDFRKDFACELFNPEEWTDIFKRSGAKYVVLTSKHHDGYCLWPNKEANISYNRKWNTVESGPHRDLVGDLGEAVRDAGLKMGYYYSLWDWFNPYWTTNQQSGVVSGKQTIYKDGKKQIIDADPDFIKESESALNKYIHEVMYPQFKELVLKYEPALIFSDGDWWMDDEKWQTKPLLAWLFNNTTNMDELVINDRWGKVRGKHGGYYSTEYEPGFEGGTIPWEECRGMGMSFGINRIENIDDYRTTKELLFMLVDIVSRGGNLLLNIGPSADGTIPVIMQDRLLQMGKWLKINGEAIFDTRSWIKDAQWSKGKMPEFTRHDFHYGFPIFNMTIDPKPGDAVKEFYFTKNDGDLYALSPDWPNSDKIFIKDVKIEKNSTASLLGCDKNLPIEVNNGGIEIDISSIGINDVAVKYLFTFRITGIE